MEILNKIIESKSNELPELGLNRDSLEKLYSVYPFNRFEYAISHLLSRQVMSLDEYLHMRAQYHERNKYLHLFQITSPRAFGSWAENHLTELVQELRHPNKTLDVGFKGEYDLLYEDVKIEVKASRAVDSTSDAQLIEKALPYASAKSFNMNFQQLKANCCDVFIWIGVWSDCIRYWVLSSKEVRENKYYSAGQHRGNRGEGQLWITNENIDEFKPYLVPPKGILDKVIEKAR